MKFRALTNLDFNLELAEDPEHPKVDLKRRQRIRIRRGIVVARRKRRTDQDPARNIVRGLAKKIPRRRKSKSTISNLTKLIKINNFQWQG